MILFIQLLLAHLLGDFVLQPSKWVAQKERNKYKSAKLYLHALIHFVLILLVTMDWHYWKPAAIVASAHLLIDVAKLQLTNTKNKKWLFVIDQILHIAVIVATVWWIEHPAVFLSENFLNNALIMVTGAVFLTTPSSVIIKMILSKWAPATEIKTDVIETKSLQHAGMMIGYLERLIVFIFLLNGQWAAVGFLVTAKSVFRFSDLKVGQDRKLTEYILIGTLLSFGIAILVALAVKKILESGFLLNQ